MEVLKPNGETRIWVPAALIRETPFQKTLANKFGAQNGTAKLNRSRQDSLGIVTASYPAGCCCVMQCRAPNPHTKSRQ